MTNRQRALIRFIHNEGGQTTLLRLVKLCFLLRTTSIRAPKAGLYDFVPYKYGPYSFTLNHELRAIEKDGFVRINAESVTLCRVAHEELGKIESGFASEIDSLTRRFRNVTTSNLVKRVYADYPWYTAKAKEEQLRRAQIPTAQPAIFTVGYEGLMLDRLLDLLLSTGVKTLVDVRCNPIARRFGFHKSTIERHCRELGMRYVHMPELGIPSEKRASLTDFESYLRLFEDYEHNVLAKSEEAVGAVSSLMQNEPAALMCMEANPECCHRSHLAAAVSRKTNLPVKELRAL